MIKNKETKLNRDELMWKLIKSNPLDSKKISSCNEERAK